MEIITQHLNSGFMDITPKIANEFLDMNIHNRDVTPKNLKRYKHAMSQNRWKINGDSIRFTKSGRMIDGQHRLLSIIQTGTTQKILVVTGLDEDVIDTIDTGKNRSASDVLKMSKIDNHTGVASLARKIIIYFNGKLPFANSASKGSFNTVIDNDEILAFTIANQAQMNDLVLKGLKYQKRFKKLNSGDVSFLYYLFQMKSSKAAEDFFDLLSTGLSTDPCHPIIVLRNKLINDVNMANGRIRYLSFIKAWNAYRTNKTVKRITVNDDEVTPKII
jgi:hypothetical protein